MDDWRSRNVYKIVSRLIEFIAQEVDVNQNTAFAAGYCDLPYLYVCIYVCINTHLND